MASAVMVGSSADTAGFEPLDVVVSIDGEKVKRFEDIRRVVAIALDTPLEFVVLRDGKEVTLNALPKKEEITDRFGFTHSQGLLGILGPRVNGIAVQNIVSVNGKSVAGLSQARNALFNAMGQKITLRIKGGADANGAEKFDDLIVSANSATNEDLKKATDMNVAALIISNRDNQMLLRQGVIQSFRASVSETFSITVSTLKALGQMFTGTRSATELGGIIRIGAIAGDMAQAGFLAIVTFTALLSINLGLINLFPIPMLDGGHLTFYAIEAIKGKPLSERTQDYAFRFGFGILIALMLFANLNDLYQLFIK
jgi:regulator of sigma E protease